MTRTALYRRVWSEPMSKLAGEFGISDVGLAKVCRKHSIPCPSRGYWAKKAHGQDVTDVPLPDPENDATIKFRDTPASRINASQTKLKPDAGPPVEFRDHLRGAHPLVSEAKRQLLTADKDSEGFLTRPDDLVLNLRVTKATLHRAFLIMDAILRALSHRGYSVSSGPTVLIEETPVRFHIVEFMETSEEEPGEPDFNDRYQFGHSRFRKLRRPSGKLAIEIDDKSYWVSRSRSNWRDTPTKPLEERLDLVVAGLVEYAARLRQAAEDRRLEEERRQAEEQRRQEAARERAVKRKAIEAEQTRVDRLLSDCRDWNRSNELRAYIEAATQAYLQRDAVIEADSEFARWLQWAQQQADRLDPLKLSPPSILDEKVEDEADDDSRRYRRW